MQEKVDYYKKYLTYKIKYLNLKSEIEGGTDVDYVSHDYQKKCIDQIIPSLKMCLEILKKAKVLEVKTEMELEKIKPSEIFEWAYHKSKVISTRKRKKGQPKYFMKSNEAKNFYECIWMIVDYFGDSDGGKKSKSLKIVEKMGVKTISELAKLLNHNFNKEEALNLIKQIKEDYMLKNNFWKDYIDKLEKLL